MIALALVGCTPDSTSDSDVPVELVDPFVRAPVHTYGMTDVSSDLLAVLENGTLRGSCDRYRDAPDDLGLRRRCGKEQFFYETFDTVGVPRPIVSFLLEELGDLVGPGFSAYGLIADPTSPAGVPLGMAPSADDSIAFTCASCHFGRLPDGRYAVGAPNQDYDYGAHNLSMTLVPMSLLGSDGIDPEAAADVQPLLDALDASPALRVQLGLALLPLAGTPAPEFPLDVQRLYARWVPGTMDFAIAPLPLDDGVHTISRIPPLWRLPTLDERDAAGMDHAMLGWTGNTPSTEDFVYWFGVLGGGRHPTPEDIGPITAYLESLEAPEPPVPSGDPRGLELFAQHCGACHSGPSGSGLTVYPLDEIGTDPAIGLWMDPTGSGAPCCNAELPADFVTGAIKSPRLVGLWAQQRFLHNGSVGSIEALLCVEPREGVVEPAFGDAGHEYGCELDLADREILVEWLATH
ncbi:MAG: hypothetical protein R3F61_14840 [Myxococcota bacterium]